MDQNRGYIHLYFGDGKGKTTAAVGLALRYAYYNDNVIWGRFMKTNSSGEVENLKRFKVKVFQAHIPHGFTWTLTSNELNDVKKGHEALLLNIIDICSKNEKGLLVLDEIVGAVYKNLVDKEILLNFLENKPESLEIVMTGRNPVKELLDRSDYVTEMLKVKHPFDKGLKSREGIEK